MFQRNYCSTLNVLRGNYHERRNVRYSIRVILIAGLGTDHPAYFFTLPIGCFCCCLFVAISSQILIRVLTGRFGSSVPIFVVFTPIWTSFLWLDLIMIFWSVLSLLSTPSFRASYPWLWLPPAEAEELNTCCRGYGSLW